MQDPKDVKNAIAAVGPTLKHLSLSGKKVTNDVIKTVGKHINPDLFETLHVGRDCKIDCGLVHHTLEHRTGVGFSK